MTENRADLSIIVAMHNSENTILECLQSIYSQEFAGLNVQVVVIDDASRDDSIIVCKKSEWGKRIELVALAENSGQAEARNIGIDQSTADFILILDSDDILIDGSIVELWNSIKYDESLEVVFGNRIEFGPWGYFCGNCFRAVPFDLLEKLILKGKNPITHSGVIFRKSWFFEVGCYDTNVKHAEDLSLWRRGLGTQNFLNVDVPTVYYRIQTFIRPFKYWSDMESARRKLAGFDVQSDSLPSITFLSYFRYVASRQFRFILSRLLDV